MYGRSCVTDRLSLQNAAQGRGVENDSRFANSEANDTSDFCYTPWAIPEPMPLLTFSRQLGAPPVTPKIMVL